MNNSTNVAPLEPGLTDVATLAAWSAKLEQHLQANEPYPAATVAQGILKQWPRHLPTYQRLLQVAWQLKRWEEGEEWARRLLRADPCSALAWRALAMAAEQREQRAQAHAIWQRAFEAEPYEPEIRAGLARTTLPVRPDPRVGLQTVDPLALNLACLARLALRGWRWDRAAMLYQKLLELEPRRIDFQVGLLVARWQQQARREAYSLARTLVQNQPHLLLAWVVIDAFGDENDKALARNPLATMDPAGEYVALWLGKS